MAKTVARKSVPLTHEEIQAVAELRIGDTQRSAALREAAGLRETERSEAAVLHALVTHGLRRVREEADESGYAALAEAYRTPEEQKYRQAARTRRLRRADGWDDAPSRDDS